jgi:hypothetical protein
MKLSKKTINVLKNFSGINSNILIQPGNKLSTIAVLKNIMASVDVDETFPSEFGIFNLQEFLGVIGLMNDPELEFDEKTHAITIKEGHIRVKYIWAARDVLTYPQKDIKFPDTDVEFSLTAEQLSQLKKASGIVGVPDIAFVGDGQKLYCTVIDRKNPSTNEFSLDVDTKTDKVFTAYFKIENFKQIEDDYDIQLSSKNIAKFTGRNEKIVYYVAMEPDSTFN